MKVSTILVSIENDAIQFKAGYTINNRKYMFSDAGVNTVLSRDVD